MKRFYILIAATLLTFGNITSVYGGVSKSVLKEAERIESKPEIYIFGRGEAATEEEAVQNALGNIVRQISVSVSSSISSYEHEINTDGKIDSRSDFKSTVNSWTQNIRLKGVQKLLLTDSSPYKVLCYLDKEAVDDMIATRTQLVTQHCRDAMRAEEELRLDDALKLFYRAYTTLQTLPDRESIMRTINGQNRHLDNWIPIKMKEICQDVKLGIAKVEPREDGETYIEMTASYKGEPVRSVAVTWFDGTGRSGIHTLRDGTGILELQPGTKTNPLTLDIEYRFVEDSYVDRDLHDVIANFNGAGLLADAPKKVLNSGKAVLKADKKETKAFNEAIRASANEGIAFMEKSKIFEDAMADIVRAISRGNVSTAASRFSPRALEQFQSLLSQGKATLIGKAAPGSYSFYPMGERVVCRSIPMSFSFDNGQRVFREDLVFTFTADGIVESLAFSLGSTAREDIIAKGGEAWDDYTKMVLITFLENYRTAFALKDLNFIKSVFDENATIIVGGVRTTLNPTRQGDIMGMKSEKEYTYAKKSKDQYIKDLERCFASNSYVNLRFYGTDVEKMGMGGETFALQMKQDYTSQHYGDEGYLFLLVDFNNPDEPVIKIRTWQPERRPDLTPGLDEDDPLFGIFSPGYFG